MRINKFYTLTASALIQVVGSPAYTFSIYANALRNTLKLDHDQVAGIGTSLNLGLFMSIIAGGVYDQLEHHERMGPRITIWIGAVLAAIGYSGLWLAATGKLVVGYTGVLVLAFIAGNASSYYDTATIVTNVRNFPNHRGTVVGLLKSFVGLAGSIYSSVYASSLAPDAASYLGLLAVSTSLLPLLLSAGVNYVPYIEVAEVHTFNSMFNPETRFLLAYITVIALALYQMSSALLGAMGDLPLPDGPDHAQLLDFNTLGMFGILSVILLVPCNSGGIVSRYVHEHLADPEEGPSNLKKWWQLIQRGIQSVGSNSKILSNISGSPTAAAGAVRSADSGESSAPDGLMTIAEKDAAMDELLKEPLLQQEKQQHDKQQVKDDAKAVQLAEGDVHCEVTVLENQAGTRPPPVHHHHHHPDHVECHHHFRNLSLTQAARTVQFWLLFFLFIAGVGSGLTLLNNLGPLNIALRGVAGGQVAFVSLYAVGSAIGRLLWGHIPESFLHSRGIPRTKWLIALMACLTAAVLSAAAATEPRHLYIASPALGLCYGGVWTLIPAVAADLFGLRHFAANYAALHTACAFGSYLLPKGLADVFYDAAIAAHGGTGQQCIGRDCYGPTFLVEACVCLLATACAGVVFGTTKSVYQQLAQHLHEVDEEEQQDMMDQWHEEHDKLVLSRSMSAANLSDTC